MLPEVHRHFGVVRSKCLVLIAICSFPQQSNSLFCRRKFASGFYDNSGEEYYLSLITHVSFGCNLQPDTAPYFTDPLLICPFCIVALLLVLLAILSAFYFSGAVFVFQ